MVVVDIFLIFVSLSSLVVLLRFSCVCCVSASLCVSLRLSTSLYVSLRLSTFFYHQIIRSLSLELYIHLFVHTFFFFFSNFFSSLLSSLFSSHLLRPPISSRYTHTGYQTTLTTESRLI